MHDEQIKKSQRFFLYWRDQNSGVQLPAGVAFFDENFGEYRLKIDALPDEKAYWVKPIGTSNGKTSYRVEAVIKKAGKFSHRVEIGYGESSPVTNSDIHMDIGPFGRRLVLMDKSQHEN